MKPKKCCHPDCEKCPYVDCRWDGYSRLDDVVTDEIENELEIDAMSFEKRHSKEINDRYNHSEKGRKKAKEYMQTDNYANSQKRYRQSDNGKKKACNRSMKCYKRKSAELGRPWSTLKDNIRKHGIDMGKGEFIRSISTNGRLSIPSQFMEKLGFEKGTEVAIYVDNQGKLVIISADKARALSRKD